MGLRQWCSFYLLIPENEEETSMFIAGLVPYIRSILEEAES
jgi:hypothetical protein